MRLAQRANVRVAQQRQQAGKGFRGGAAVTHGAVAPFDDDAEARGDGFEPDVGQTRLERAHEHGGIEGRWIVPLDAGTCRLVSKHREIELDVLADDHPSGECLAQRGRVVGERGRVGHVVVVQPVDACRYLGNGNSRIDELIDRLTFERGALHRQRADLNDAIAGHVETGCLEIEHHHRERDQRCVRGRCGSSGHFPARGCALSLPGRRRSCAPHARSRSRAGTTAFPSRNSRAARASGRSAS